MPRVKKFLSRFSKEEREIIEFLLEKIISLNWRNLDIKKLRGYQNIFRVRRGRIRIIFYRNGGEIRIINIERRREDTYKF